MKLHTLGKGGSPSLRKRPEPERLQNTPLPNLSEGAKGPPLRPRCAKPLILNRCDPQPRTWARGHDCTSCCPSRCSSPLCSAIILLGLKSGFRHGFGPDYSRKKNGMGPPAGRRADFGIRPEAFLPNTGPEARFKAQKPYCVKLNPSSGKSPGASCATPPCPTCPRGTDGAAGS